MERKEHYIYKPQLNFRNGFGEVVANLYSKDQMKQSQDESVYILFREVLPGDKTPEKIEAETIEKVCGFLKSHRGTLGEYVVLGGPDAMRARTSREWAEFIEANKDQILKGGER